jgi:hypothetical protein
LWGGTVCGLGEGLGLSAQGGNGIDLTSPNDASNCALPCRIRATQRKAVGKRRKMEEVRRLRSAGVRVKNRKQREGQEDRRRQRD